MDGVMDAGTSQARTEGALGGCDSLTKSPSPGDPALVPAAVARALHLMPQPEIPLMEQLSHYLRPCQTLLLLDNCEHVLAETAALVAGWLVAAPASQVLVTSQAPFHVRGEQVLVTEPLLVLPAESTSSLSEKGWRSWLRRCCRGYEQRLPEDGDPMFPAACDDATVSMVARDQTTHL
jgi:hypothetical protein